MQLTPNDKAKYLQQKNAEIDKKQAVERQGLKEKLEHDPQMHQKAGLTEAGYAAFMNQIAGTNQQGFSDKTAYGNVDKRVLKDGQGNTIMTQEKGAVGGVHDKKEMGALAKELKAAGFKNTAQEIESMAAQGKGFNFDMTRDKSGHITGFTATGGATASLNDKAREDMGRLKEYTNLDKSTVGSISWKGKSKIEEDTDKKLIDKGLRETIGNRSSRGDRLDHFDQKQVATPSGMENGYYYKAKNGTEFLVSGQKDGLLHQKMQKDGKAVDIMIDPRTGAVLLEKGESGKKEVIFADRTEYQGGSAVTGSFNSAVSKAVSKATGWDEKSVQLGVGTFEDLTSSVLPLANAGSGGAGVKGRLNETKDVLQKGKATGQKVLDKMTRANKSIRVDEAGRVVTRKGTGSAPAPAAGGAPAPSAGGVPRGDIGGGLTNTSGSPSPSPSGYSGLPGGGNQAPRTAPRPAARPAGNSNLGGINNTHPAAPNNGGYGKVGTGNVKSPKPAGAGAPKKALHPAKIM
ncbi:MAG: hypothetical protein FPO08_07500 [Geobacter sp.]|nr:MAG: hypothetical protein FPO08_07500 [Geobacter sp.]